MNMTQKTQFDAVMADLESVERRAQDAHQSRRNQLADIFKRMDSDINEIADNAMTEWHEFGLSFDYVEPFTYDDQRDGYWRFQISWGGPSEELRAWFDSNDQLRALEFWFLDWGEGAMVDVIDCPIMRQAMNWNYELMK